MPLIRASRYVSLVDFTLQPRVPLIRMCGVLLQESGAEGISRDNWDQLLDAENAHKLMYSLQIVESLSRPPKFRRNSYDVSTSV